MSHCQQHHLIRRNDIHKQMREREGRGGGTNTLSDPAIVREKALGINLVTTNIRRLSASPATQKEEEQEEEPGCEARSVTQQQPQRQSHRQRLAVDCRSGAAFLLNNLDTQARRRRRALSVCRALAF